jgi:hypothetical protein
LTTENLPRYYNGIPLEKYVCRFFEQNGFGSELDHNTFNPSKYPFDNHNIVDIVITNKALIECTNPKETTFLSDEIVKEKLDYFTRKDPKHLLPWFLIISFAVFSDTIKQLIDKLGITLIVLNRYANTNNRSAFLRALYRSKLYSVVKHLKPKKSKLSNSNQLSITTLPQYVVSNPALNILTYLYQHTEPTENSTTETEPSTNRRFLDRPRFDNRPRFS